MPKLPEPPPADELRRIGPELVRLDAGTLLWRIYFQGGPHPTEWRAFRAFGPTGSRFDHHEPPPSVQARKILYAAIDGPTPFAEVFQDTRVIDRRRRDPWLVGFELARPLTLLDLTGAWPTRAGASTAIHSGPRPRAQRWSRALYEAFPDIEGLRYCSSMNGNQHAFALYERAEDALPASPQFHRALADPNLALIVARAATRFRYAVV